MGKVMVFGTFDPLHKGHLDYFKQALSIERKIGDRWREGYILTNIVSVY